MEKITCDCGMIVAPSRMSLHAASANHADRMRSSAAGSPQIESAAVPTVAETVAASLTHEHASVPAEAAAADSALGLIDIEASIASSPYISIVPPQPITQEHIEDAMKIAADQPFSKRAEHRPIEISDSLAAALENLDPAKREEILSAIKSGGEQFSHETQWQVALAVEGRPTQAASAEQLLNADVERRATAERLGRSSLGPHATVAEAINAGMQILGTVDPSMRNDTDYRRFDEIRASMQRAEDAQMNDPAWVKNPFLEQVGTYVANPAPISPDALAHGVERQAAWNAENVSDEIARQMADATGAPMPPRTQSNDADLLRHHAPEFNPQTTGEQNPAREMFFAQQQARERELAGELENGLRDIAAPNSMHLADPDEFERVLGDVVKVVSASFDWAIDPLSRHRFQFTRYYYQLGIILDFYPTTSGTHLAEVQRKAAAIERYNAIAVRKIGYIPMLASATLDQDTVERACRGEVLGFRDRGDASSMRMGVIDGVPTMIHQPMRRTA